MAELLNVSDWSVDIAGTSIVRDMKLCVHSGTITALVGESGSGKSVTCRSLMGLMPGTGSFSYRGQKVANPRHLRGQGLGYIPQNPVSSLNPVRRIGVQLREALCVLRPELAAASVSAHAWELLKVVRLAEPERIMASYPHELSGGMCQRVMIALALAGEPSVLIADEPTTALDLTTQAEIMSLLSDMCRQREIGILLVTHDLPLVSTYCSQVTILRHGQIVEQGAVGEVFVRPRQPYTQELLASVLRPSSR